MLGWLLYPYFRYEERSTVGLSSIATGVSLYVVHLEVLLNSVVMAHLTTMEITSLRDADMIVPTLLFADYTTFVSSSREVL